MSKRGGGKRPTKLVNFSRDEDQSSAPVNIPPSQQNSRRNYPGVQSAPGGRAGPHRSLLVDPILDEADVMISSSVNSDTSTMERRREAAKGGLGEYNASHHGGYGAIDRGAGYRDNSPVPELEQSAEIAEDYVKIAQRHKREDHGTTYECLTHRDTYF